MVGRIEEIAKLKGLLGKKRSEFAAVYGRRCVGKTYLIRQVYADKIIFECSGLYQKDMTQQLENFWLTLAEYNRNGQATLTPKTWLQAFALLKNYIYQLDTDKPKVIFLDEIAWFETPRSGFLSALDNFWNQFCSKRSDIILVICGSAASWIINKVINDTGGLHNRITTHIQLMPFKLSEVKAFLEQQNVVLTLRDIAQIYMCIGGIPFYLRDIEAGKSVAQILDDLLFKEQATLKREFANLYAALFKNSDMHEAIVKALATKNKGLTRSEIIAATGLNSGGGLSLVLEELVQCGFVKQIFPLQKSKEDTLYRLIDEYTLCYFKFLQHKKNEDSWLQQTQNMTYQIWLGYAFENLCLKHTAEIKKSLGIKGIITNEYSWIYRGNTTEKGAQIDLIIDRNDNCINILELKFGNSSFEITKAYASKLNEKVEIFKTQTKTKKNVFLTLITPFGAKKNSYFLENITNELVLEDLL